MHICTHDAVLLHSLRNSPIIAHNSYYCPPSDTQPQAAFVRQKLCCIRSSFLGVGSLLRGSEQFVLKMLLGLIRGALPLYVGHV